MSHKADLLAPPYGTVELPDVITIKREKLMLCAEDAEAHMCLFALNVQTLMEPPQPTTGIEDEPTI